MKSSNLKCHFYIYKLDPIPVLNSTENIIFYIILYKRTFILLFSKHESPTYAIVGNLNIYVYIYVCIYYLRIFMNLIMNKNSELLLQMNVSFVHDIHKLKKPF